MAEPIYCHCEHCLVLIETGWKFCPHCGSDNRGYDGSEPEHADAREASTWSAQPTWETRLRDEHRTAQTVSNLVDRVNTLQDELARIDKYVGLRDAGTDAENPNVLTKAKWEDVLRRLDKVERGYFGDGTQWSVRGLLRHTNERVDDLNERLSGFVEDSTLARRVDNLKREVSDLGERLGAYGPGSEGIDALDDRVSALENRLLAPMSGESTGDALRDLEDRVKKVEEYGKEWFKTHGQRLDALNEDLRQARDATTWAFERQDARLRRFEGTAEPERPSEPSSGQMEGGSEGSDTSPAQTSGAPNTPQPASPGGLVKNSGFDISVAASPALTDVRKRLDALESFRAVNFEDLRQKAHNLESAFREDLPGLAGRVSELEHRLDDLPSKPPELIEVRLHLAALEACYYEKPSWSCDHPLNARAELQWRPVSTSAAHVCRYCGELF